MADKTTAFLRSIALQRDSVPSFDEYPFCIPAVRNLDTLAFHPRVTFFVGDNGTGKSTLLEAVAVASGFNPEGGGPNFAFSTRASHSHLCNYLTLTRGLSRPRDGYFFRAESFFNVATEIEKLDAVPSRALPIIDSYGGRSLHEQSHGESLFALLTERFGGRGLYLLDEPEAALSPTRQMSMLTVMANLIRRGSQFIIATHSPIIMAYPEATIYSFSDHAIEPTLYTETEHFTVTRDFMNRRDRMLEILLAEEEA